MISALDNEKRCYICGSVIGLERHHIFAGPNRKHSERWGLWCYLCHRHHTGKDGAQYNAELGRMLKQEAQQAFERDHTRAEWMAIFRKNYL